MDNIEFRAWDKVCNKMADSVELISFETQEVKIAYHQTIEGIKVHPLTYYRKFKDVVLLQYTGFKGKDFHEYYNGDMFSIRLSDGSKLIKIIEYIPEKYGFCIANVDDLKHGKYMEIWGHMDKRWLDDRFDEIVYEGNIYENPELLEVGHE